MDTSKKIIIAVSIIFILVVAIISGRMILNNFIQKKINEVKPTEVIAEEVKKLEFYQKIETFGTALANQSFSIRIKKTELISSLEFDKNLMIQKNQLIAQLKTEKIIAPFSGRLGVREITPGILGGEDSIIATLDDIETIKLDIKVPEESIIQQGNRTVVYKVIEDKSVALTEVKTGISGKVEIVSGLNPGDKIVIEGVSKVRDKAQIKLINK